jgi:hypothetical protein
LVLAGFPNSILASMLALTTLFYTALQTEYFNLQPLVHDDEILGATTVAYVALVGSAYVLPNLPGAPPSAFNPTSIFKQIQRAASDGLNATMSFISPSRRRG